MYATDQKEIAAWVAEKPHKRFELAVRMASLSIQQPWESVGRQLADVADQQGESRYLWGMKGMTWEYFRQRYDQGERLYRAIGRAVAAGRVDRAHLLLLGVPGINIAKGGFILQLCWGVSGCMDSVNCKRLGIDQRKLRIPKTLTGRTKTRKIREYLALIEECGGTATLWDQWCHWLADRDATFIDAREVSRRHVEYVQGIWQDEELPV